MRVVSGSARGTKLSSIDSLSTRPTQDRVKESLFNIIFDKIYECSFLDLFAGSGAIGIEALRRVYNLDYKKYLKETKEKFDIIFIDPPYKADISVDAFRMIKENELLKRDGFVVIETDEYLRDKSELEKITDIEVFDHRKYGRANLIFIK